MRLALPFYQQVIAQAEITFGQSALFLFKDLRESCGKQSNCLRSGQDELSHTPTL